MTDHPFRLPNHPSFEEARAGIPWFDFSDMLQSAVQEGVIAAPFADRESFTTDDFWGRYLEDLIVTEARWGRAHWPGRDEKPSWETILEWVKSNDRFKERHAITKAAEVVEGEAMRRVMQLKGARTIMGAGLPSATPEIEAAVQRVAARARSGVQEVEAASDAASAQALCDAACADIAAITP